VCDNSEKVEKEKRVNLVNIKSLGEKMKRGSRVYVIE
jgi:hypothetical protein